MGVEAEYGYGALWLGGAVEIDQKTGEFLCVNRIGDLAQWDVFGVESDVHLRAAEHHDRFSVKPVAQGVGVAFVVDAGLLPGLLVNGQGGDSIGLFGTRQSDGVNERCVAVGTAGSVHDAGANGKRIGKRFDGVKIIRYGSPQQIGCLLKHGTINAVDRFGHCSDRLVVFEGKLNADAVEISDGDGDFFHGVPWAMRRALAVRVRRLMAISRFRAWLLSVHVS